MIRPASPSDVPRLVALGAEMHADSSYRDQPYMPEKVADLMHRLIGGAGVVFVSERAGEVVGGMAGGVAPNWFNDEAVAFEYGLFMQKKARQSTAAARLIDTFCYWAKARGAKRLRVGITTGVQVEGIARLYRSRGFADSGLFLTKEF